ncbi:hypothetical protein [[Leptolyngbya] sp. PCC 7376]|uniref:hypothetical protein n=1 Tax=[Leptolyngbya] sp. PCC 7376 TaxID=111781 RepID=UPI001C1E2C42|nr:hypothetical protein [[Leptolyngbya] sp. PCC 7376]
MPCPNITLLPGAVAEMLVSVSISGKLTLGDRYGLMAASLDEHLSEDERRAVNRILRSVNRGKVDVTKEI